MALQTTTQLYIGSTPIHSYVSLQLDQEISEHHTLELVCRRDVLESFTEEIVGTSKDYLGEIITVSIRSELKLGDYKELEFKGIVTELKSTKGLEYGSGDLVTIIAHSTSILAENGAHSTSFTNETLAEILQWTFRGYDARALQTNFAPRNSERLNYVVQWTSSDFKFASRLARYYNEWFYYDGKQLVFGAPSTQETELTHGVDLKDFSIKFKTSPNRFEYVTKDYLSDQLVRKKSASVTTSSDGYLGFVNKTSDRMFYKESQIVHAPHEDAAMAARFDRQVEQYTRATALNQKIAVGMSDNTGVQLGAVIKVAGYGRFRITKVSHTNVEGGVYTNTFEGVQAESIDYPLMDIHQYPKGDMEVAKVIDNKDPEGLGRVRVRCVWQQADGVTTPWIRVMTPHAGGEKGFFFLPEYGEEVVVSYQNRNKENPVVMGSLYNGAASPDTNWQGSNNDIKAIRTKSGHSIIFNDTRGAESVTITDKNNNTVLIDTANDAIHVTANETMTFDAKNIVMKAQKNIRFEAQDTIQAISDGNTTMTTKGTMSIQSDAETQIKSQASITLQAETETAITAQDINAIAKAKVAVSGQQTALKGQTTEVSGAAHKLRIV